MDRKRTFLLALAAAFLTLGTLWYAHRPEPFKVATMEDVRAEAAHGGYRLIDTGELARLYRQPHPGLLIVDTRQEWEFRSGHIKGAVDFPLEPTWWSRWRAQGRLSALLGPDKDRLVVFY
jgi:rhodanese-related sulfurtransferase